MYSYMGIPCPGNVSASTGSPWQPLRHNQTHHVVNNEIRLRSPCKMRLPITNNRGGGGCGAAMFNVEQQQPQKDVGWRADCLLACLLACRSGRTTHPRPPPPQGKSLWLTVDKKRLFHKHCSHLGFLLVKN